MNQDTSNLANLNNIITSVNYLSKIQFIPTAPVETIKFKVDESEQEKSDGVYSLTGLVSSTSGGTGLAVTVTVSNNAVTSIDINNGGTGFKLGDIINIAGSSTGNGGNIKLEVTKINVTASSFGATADARDVTLGDEIQKIMVKINELINVLKT